MTRARTRLIVLFVSTTIGSILAWCVFSWAESRRIGSLTLRKATMPEVPHEVPATATANSDSNGPLAPEEWAYFMTPQQAAHFFGYADGVAVYDPWTYVRGVPHTDRTMRWPEAPTGKIRSITNGAGLREDRDLTEPLPSWRVLVAGDSHTSGVCSNSDSFPNRLEALLLEQRPGTTVEVLNAGHGGYSFHSYLGTWLRFREFRPQVFVVAVYGGNDFGDILGLSLYFTGQPWPAASVAHDERRGRALEISTNSMGQGLDCLETLRTWPAFRAESLRFARELCLEMKRYTTAAGAELVIAFLPSAFDLNWDPMPEHAVECMEALRFDAADLSRTRTLGDQFVSMLRAEGITTVDLRASFEAEPMTPYWKHDLHLSIRGHDLVAQALLPVVEKALASR